MPFNLLALTFSFLSTPLYFPLGHALQPPFSLASTTNLYGDPPSRIRFTTAFRWRPPSKYLTKNYLLLYMHSQTFACDPLPEGFSRLGIADK